MKMWDNESIGERIRRLREERNLTQKQLGARAGLSEQSINRLETGVTRVMGEFRERLAMALDISEDYLQNGDSHAERETTKLIEALRPKLNITEEEEYRLKGVAAETLKLRKNAKIPLSEVDIESLLTVIRGR